MYKELVEKVKEIDNFVRINMNFYSYEFRIEKVRSEIIRNYILDNLSNFVEFEDDFKSGVYFIEDFYIGKTKDIRHRISSHITEIFDYYHFRNDDKCELIDIILKSGNRIKVKQLSKDMKDEESLIRKMCYNYQLVNVEFNECKISFPYIQEKKVVKKVDSYLSKFSTVCDVIKFISNYQHLDLTTDSNYCVVITNKKDVYIYQRKDILSIFFEIEFRKTNIIISRDIDSKGCENFDVIFVKNRDKSDLSMEYINKGYNVLTVYKKSDNRWDCPEWVKQYQKEYRERKRNEK